MYCDFDVLLWFSMLIGVCGQYKATNAEGFAEGIFLKQQLSA